jgi:hypothetical protein
MSQHCLSDAEVGNHSIFQGADGCDAARGAPKHPFSVIAHGDHFIGAGFYGYNGWFTEDNSVIFDVNEGVGGAEINTNVFGDEAEKFTEHVWSKK